MDKRKTLISFIIAKLDEYKEEGLINRDIEFDEKTCLYGQNGLINSLNLVLLIVNLEEFAGEQWKREIVIADNRVFSMRSSPFSTIENLADYINELIGETGT